MKRKWHNSGRARSVERRGYRLAGRESPATSPERLGLRMKVCATFLGLAFLGLSARTLRLQAISEEKLDRLAANQYSQTITLTPQRGPIFDVNGSPLAISVEADSVYADPRAIEDKPQTAALLAKVLGANRASILAELNKKRAFVWIARKIESDPAERLRRMKFKGIGLLRESKRHYPNGELAANLLGLTGIDANGLAGLELKYDAYLLNPQYKLHGERDAKGRLILQDPALVRQREEATQSLHLTLDKTIQYIAERELAEAVESHGAKAGVIIVSEPGSGRILAMASRPTYDPNDPSRVRPETLTNRAVEAAYEPGSTFKTILAAASVESGTVQPGELFYCKRGEFEIAGKKIHESSKKDWLDLEGILKYSSNIGAAKMGMLLGRKRFGDYLQRLGFGRKSAIDLPGETAGLVRPPDSWTPTDLVNISFGQGIAASPLQLMMAFNTVINGGRLMRPYVVERIVDHSGQIILETWPQETARLFSEKTSRTIADLLVAVTEPGGTGVRAALANFTVAGKTGTSQKVDPATGSYSDEHYISSFVGFAPLENPRLSILVMIDEPRGAITTGGYVAAPVFGRVASRILTYLRVPYTRGPTLAGAPAGATPASGDRGAARDPRQVL